MIPSRAYTLRVLRLMDNHGPILMLTGDDDGYGTRWTLGGQQVEPAIARYLMIRGYVADAGATEFGARMLMLTPLGTECRERGEHWWAELSFMEKLKAIVFG